MATRADIVYAPKFFMIITDPLSDILKIPTEFMTRFGKTLRDQVLLKVPSGSVSVVEVVRCNGDTMLRKGWKEFKECHSIGFGNFLLFEYSENSQFDVAIFDTSAVEINYSSGARSSSDDDFVLPLPLPTCNRRKGKAKSVEDSETDSDVYIEKLTSSQARKENIGKTKHCDFPDVHPLKGSSVWRTQDHSFCPTKKPKSIYEECGSGRRQKQRAVARKTSIAYQKALAFTSTHTLHSPFFISLMHPSYVSSGFSLSLPMHFAKENLPSKSTTDLTIRLKNGKAYPIKRHVGKRQVYLTAGWMEFVVENDLKVGDACLFQVAKGTGYDFVWDVDIFRS